MIEIISPNGERVILNIREFSASISIIKFSTINQASQTIIDILIT